MSETVRARTLDVRHVQAARALITGVAAAVITFSADHSAAVGLAVFGGFATALGIVLVLSARVIHRPGERWVPLAVGVASIAAGLIAVLVGRGSTVMFFAVVISWAVVTGLIEVVAGGRGLRTASRADNLDRRGDARDSVITGILTLALAVALALIPSGFALHYYIADAAQTFTLTGVSIGVGILGAYAAVIAVYLAIAAFSPRTRIGGESVLLPDERGTA